MLDALMTLYADVPVCIKTAAGYSSFFSSYIGLKQGCPLSPTLFGIYIDDLQRWLMERIPQSMWPSIGGFLLPALLYADDLVLLAVSVEGLQQQLNELAAYSSLWGLAVNVANCRSYFC